MTLEGDLNRVGAAVAVFGHDEIGHAGTRVVALTPKSRKEFFRHFGGHLAAMRDVAEKYSDDELATIAGFIGELSDAISARE